MDGVFHPGSLLVALSGIAGFVFLVLLRRSTPRSKRSVRRRRA